MPFKSLKQERWAHMAEGRAALGNKLAEFDAASKGLKLPMYANKAPRVRKTPRRRPAAFGVPSTANTPFGTSNSPLKGLLGLK